MFFFHFILLQDVLKIRARQEKLVAADRQAALRPTEIVPVSDAVIFIAKQVLAVIDPVKKALNNAVRGIAQDDNDPPNLSYFRGTLCDATLLNGNKPRESPVRR